MQLTLGQAARLTGTSRTTLTRAIKAGRLPATRRDDGSYSIDPSELARVYDVTPATDGSTGGARLSPWRSAAQPPPPAPGGGTSYGSSPFRARRSKRMYDRHVWDQLTQREKQIVSLIASGKKNKQIASDIGVTNGTINVHVNNILKKVGVQNRTALAVLFVTLHVEAGGVPHP